jgi:hypothetical protein
VGRGEVHLPSARLPAAGLDVLEHVGHVVGVLLVGELAVAGVHQPRIRRLAVRRPVGLAARQDLRPFHDDVVPFDRSELDRELPVLHAQHGVDEPARDLLLALDATPGAVDVDGVVGVEIGERAERVRFEPLINAPAELVIALDRGADLVAGECHVVAVLSRLLLLVVARGQASAAW